MARIVGSPILAACISIAISLVTVILVWLVSGGTGSGDVSQVRALPWWVLLGGVIGVVFVAGSVIVAPVLGVALFFVCVVAGQLLCATLADHFGAFGMAVQPVTGMKVLGLGLVLAGAALVRGG
jgi:transporter family-2 protein